MTTSPERYMPDRYFARAFTWVVMGEVIDIRLGRLYSEGMVAASGDTCNTLVGSIFEDCAKALISFGYIGPTISTASFTEAEPASLLTSCSLSRLSSTSSLKCDPVPADLSKPISKP